jgi:predicted RNase H-like HicB family nuclease
MGERREVDLSAYTITWTERAAGRFLGAVAELPGCLAVAASETGKRGAISQAIILFWDEHPDVRRRYRSC